jgi:hypothetical protein
MKLCFFGESIEFVFLPEPANEWLPGRILLLLNRHTG